MATGEAHLPPELIHEICSYFPLTPGVVTISYMPCTKIIIAKRDGLPKIMGANSATYKSIVLYTMQQGYQRAFGNILNKAVLFHPEHDMLFFQSYEAFRCFFASHRGKSSTEKKIKAWRMAIDVGEVIEKACVSDSRILMVFEKDVAGSLFEHTEDVKNLYLVRGHAEESRHRISHWMRGRIECWLEEEFCGADASRKMPRVEVVERLDDWLPSMKEGSADDSHLTAADKYMSS